MWKKRFPQLQTHLAAVLFGTVWAADRCRGDGASQLSVCAQHGVRLTRSSRTQFTDTGRQFCPGVILQYVGFPLTGTLIHLHSDQAIRSIYPVINSHTGTQESLNNTL